VFAHADQSDAEIVAIGGIGGGFGGSGTVAVVCVQPNSVVVAVGESSSAAGQALRANGVSHRNVSLDVALRGGQQENAAEAIVRRGDSLDLCSGGSTQKYPNTLKSLDQPRSKDGHVVLPDHINAILRGEVARGNAVIRRMGRTGDRETVQFEGDIRSTEFDAR